MYRKHDAVAVIVMALIVILVLNLSVLALTAWVFHITGSAWSFAILLCLFKINTGNS